MTRTEEQERLLREGNWSPPERTETQLAADVLAVLVHHGVIDPKRWTPHQLAIYIGCTRHQIEASIRCCSEVGPDALRPRTEPTPPERTRRARSTEAFTEKQCTKCGEWFPVEHFDRLPASKRRGRLCRDCFDEAERAHHIAIQKAEPLRQVIAFFTAKPVDAVVGMTCGNCDEPIRLNEPLFMQAEPRHVDCPKVTR